MAAIQPIRLLWGNDFQQFASVLLVADDDEFRAIRGDGGDFGADGFTALRSIVYQAYAPEQMIAHKVRKKIDETLGKAQELRHKGMPVHTIRFLTPLDLTLEQYPTLKKLRVRLGSRRSPGAKLGSWRSWLVIRM